VTQKFPIDSSKDYLEIAMKLGICICWKDILKVCMSGVVGYRVHMICISCLSVAGLYQPIYTLIPSLT